MRAVFILVAIVLTIFVAGGLALSTPALQDRLFDRALEQAMGDQHPELRDDDGLNIVLCGTGSPLPSPTRAQNCTMVIAGDQVFMVDAGTGSWETVQAGGVPVERLQAVLLTHYHSDHFGDLGEVQLGTWVTGRNNKLDVYGPVLDMTDDSTSTLHQLVSGLGLAYKADNEYRTAHHGKAVAPPRAAGLSARSFDGNEPTIILDEGGLIITAFPVKHDPVLPAVGYRFDYQGRSVVISGDTAPSKRLVEAARGADLLIHEAQANHMVEKMSRAAAKSGRASVAKIFVDIQDYHTSPVEAAEIANKAGVDWLVFSHLTPAPDNKVAKKIFMRGVSKVRSDKIKLGEDGMVISLPASGGISFSKL